MRIAYFYLISLFNMVIFHFAMSTLTTGVTLGSSTPLEASEGSLWFGFWPSCLRQLLHKPGTSIKAPRWEETSVTSERCMYKCMDICIYYIYIYMYIYICTVYYIWVKCECIYIYVYICIYIRTVHILCIHQLKSFNKHQMIFTRACDAGKHEAWAPWPLERCGSDGYVAWAGVTCVYSQCMIL